MWVNNVPVQTKTEPITMKRTKCPYSTHDIAMSLTHPTAKTTNNFLYWNENETPSAPRYKVNLYLEVEET